MRFQGETATGNVTAHKGTLLPQIGYVMAVCRGDKRLLRGQFAIFCSRARVGGAARKIEFKMTATPALTHNVKRFKSLQICLKELEPFIRDGQHLLTGKPFKHFEGLRSRELLGNWLCCVAINSIIQPDRLTFSSDPTGGDGIIVDTITGETSPVEHVMIPAIKVGERADIQKLVLNAVTKKQRKGGVAYASGKTLVVFLNAGGGEWYPNKIAKALPNPLLFEAVWVWGFESLVGGRYTYNVTRLDVRNGNAPAWRVRICDDFESWTVEIVQ